MADNLKKIDILAELVYRFFAIQQFMFRLKNINYPNLPQALFATWHGHQMSFYSLKGLTNINVLISPSNDGEIIARATERFGLKVIRGSKGRGGTQATLKILEKLEQGESAGLTVDGPKGPNHIAKKGIINIAKLSQVPIVPLVWHSQDINFFRLPTWDNLSFPLGPSKAIALFGEPIYVPADLNDEDTEKYRQKLQTKLLELEERAKKNYKELYKNAN